MNLSEITQKARGTISTQPTTETESTGDDSDVSASAGEIFTQLSNERRRVVVSHLYHDYDSSESITLSDLAEHLAHYECGPDYSGADRKTAYIGLYQLHLEQLESAGIIEWTDGTLGEPKPHGHVDAHTIRPGPNLEAAATILEAGESVCGGDSE